MNLRFTLLSVLSLLTISLYGQNSPYQIREAIMTSIENLDVPVEPIHHVRDLELDAGDRTVHVRIYRPSDRMDLPILYQIHGGGFIAGNLDSHDNICRMLANRTNSIVVAVDYRRPPEHPYPAALDDSFFVLDWIRDNKSSLSAHPGLYLIGDSAGGQLVPALCVKNLARENAVEIHGQVLVNPVMDMRSSSLAYKNYPFFIKPYITDESLLTDPLVSPLLFDDLAAMPPTQVIVSENDFLKAEGMAYHEKITASGQYSSLFESMDIGHLGPVWAAGHEGAMPALDAVVKQLLSWYEKE